MDLYGSLPADILQQIARGSAGGILGKYKECTAKLEVQTSQYNYAGPGVEQLVAADTSRIVLVVCPPVMVQTCLYSEGMDDTAQGIGIDAAAPIVIHYDVYGPLVQQAFRLSGASVGIYNIVEVLLRS